MQVMVLLTALVAGAAAEATLGGQYLPPRALYGGPAVGSGGVQYAAPRPAAPFFAQVSAPGPFSAGGPPSSSYGPPRPAAVAPPPVYGVPASGRSAARDDPYYEPANYEFSYMVQDAATLTDFGHQETRRDETAQGEYRVLLPDGRVQVVRYTADQTGYHPTVSYQQVGGPAPSAGGGYRY